MTALSTCSNFDSICLFYLMPGEPPVKIIEINWNARGNDRQNPQGEWLVLRGLRDTALSGWSIVNEYIKNGKKKFCRFYFPKDLYALARVRITIFSGCGESDPSRCIFYWNVGDYCGAVWNNAGDTAYLLNAEGIVVDKCFYIADDFSPFRRD